MSNIEQEKVDATIEVDKLLGNVRSATKKAISSKEALDHALTEHSDAMFDFGFDLGYKAAIDRMVQYLEEQDVDASCSTNMLEWVKNELGY